MKRYPEEVKNFIRDNVAGRSTEEITILVNAECGTDFTVSRMHAYKSNHKFSSGVPTGRASGYQTKQYPEEIRNFIQKNHLGIGPKGMAELLNQTFGTQFTTSRINSYYGNHHLVSGTDGRFPKGHISFNKGRKGWITPGSEKGWFKKGDTPHTQVSVGTETFRDDGYLWVKIADPNKWKQKHRILWEAANGPVPRDHCLLFGDQDRENITLDNLILISRGQLATLNHLNLIQGDVGLTKTGIMIADIRHNMNIRRQDAKKKRRVLI